MGLDILVGADPEVFVRKAGKKAFQSAHGLIEGDKKNPQKVHLGAVQVDGMALEFNIDPAKNEKEFITNITEVMRIMGEMVPGYEMVAQPVATFTAAHIKKQPKEALELGCEPDFNAWKGGEVNPRPNGDVNFRTGAGHVHIGWTKDVDPNDPGHREACIMATKQLDYYLGLGSLVYDTDTKRRTLYGAAGAFRPKPYGVEYRVLSNAWLQSEELMAWVYRNTVKGINDLFEGKAAYNYRNDLLREVMASGKPNLYYVRHLMDKAGLECPPGWERTRSPYDGFQKVA
ncbi:hypothetical protein D3C72_410740 [compost metagenome]